MRSGVLGLGVDKAAQERFMAGRLGAALGAVGVVPPSQVIELEVVNHQTPGA